MLLRNYIGSCRVVGGVLRLSYERWDFVTVTVLWSCSILFNLLDVTKCLPITSRSRYGYGVPPIQRRPGSTFSGQPIPFGTRRIAARSQHRNLDLSTEQRFHTLNRKNSTDKDRYEWEQSRNPILSNNNNNTSNDDISTKSSFLHSQYQANVPTTTSHSNIAAGRDRKLPDWSSCSVHVRQETEVLTTKLLALYHAMAHKTTSHTLQEFWNSYNSDRGMNNTYKQQQQQRKYYYCNEEDLARSLKESLKDAGFVLLTQRDWDLCEALNAGYLLRLT